jgi:hypothetical protein
MRTFQHRVAAVACVAALSMIFSRTGAAQVARDSSIKMENRVVYHSKTPVRPPAAKTEAKPAERAAGAVWIPGFWDLQGDPHTAPHAGWVWIPGRLENPPMPGAQWDEAHWGWAADLSTEVSTDRWWSWIPGHWDEPGRGT